MQEPLDKTLALLHDPDWRIRCNAVENLGELGEDAPLESLLAALNDPHISVRRAALASLGKLGARTPMDVLLNCLAQPNLVYTVRRTIQEHKIGRASCRERV